MRLLPSLWGTASGTPTQTNPFPSIAPAFDRMLEHFNQGMPSAFSDSRFGLLAPQIDIAETDAAVTVTAELPGVAEDDLNVSLVNDVLTLSGEKRSEETREGDDRKYRLVERSYGSFHRSIPLPFRAEPADVKAAFENGVLTVTVPKPENAQPSATRIPIAKG